MGRKKRKEKSRESFWELDRRTFLDYVGRGSLVVFGWALNRFFPPSQIPQQPAPQGSQSPVAQPLGAPRHVAASFSMPVEVHASDTLTPRESLHVQVIRKRPESHQGSSSSAQ